MCGLLEHVMNDAHTILEAAAHETEQKNHVDELASKADAKIHDVDKYVTSVVNQRKRVHNVQEQLNDEIDPTFAESVQILKERKTVLKNEIEHGQLGKLETSLGGMEESGRKQIDQIKKDLDLVRNCLNFPLQTEALTSHKAKCQQLEELLSRIGLNEEVPKRIAEVGERVCFRCQGSGGLQLGQLNQQESKWVLRTEYPLPGNYFMSGMALSPNNEMAVCCDKGGIFLYSVEGIIQNTVLKSVQIVALHFMPDGGFVIRDKNKRISMYTAHCEKLDVTLETMVDSGNVFCGLTVGNDGLIFIGYNACKKIQVFKPEGGKAIREINCNGEPKQMVAMTSSQAILVKSNWNMVHVINDVSGAIIHSISKEREYAYPAVYHDNSVIIAWVNDDQGLLSIVQYTNELKYIKNILNDFRIIKQSRTWYYLQAFKKGEISFCTSARFYIFHETWE